MDTISKGNDWFQGVFGWKCRSLLLDAMTNFPNEILNIGLHSWPVKSLSCQMYPLVSTKMTHFLMQFFEHKALIFLRQNNWSIETIFSMKNSITINSKLLPLMKELSCVRVLPTKIFNLWAVARF